MLHRYPSFSHSLHIPCMVIFPVQSPAKRPRQCASSPSSPSKIPLHASLRGIINSLETAHHDLKRSSAAIRTWASDRDYNAITMESERLKPSFAALDSAISTLKRFVADARSLHERYCIPAPLVFTMFTFLACTSVLMHSFLFAFSFLSALHNSLTKNFVLAFRSRFIILHCVFLFVILKLPVALNTVIYTDNCISRNMAVCQSLANLYLLEISSSACQGTFKAKT